MTSPFTVRILRPLPRTITRPLSILALVAWVATMGVMINRSYLQASSRNLATDLARYGSTAQWRGVYYRGEKIGFTVSQVQATDDGFELQEDGRLQFSLLGAHDRRDSEDDRARRSHRSRSRRSIFRWIPAPARWRSRAGSMDSDLSLEIVSRPDRAPRRGG